MDSSDPIIKHLLAIPTKKRPRKRFDAMDPEARLLTNKERLALDKIKREVRGRIDLRCWTSVDVQKDAEFLAVHWGLRSTSQAIELAIRYLAKQTRDGLQEVVL